MKILIASYSDLSGGAARASYRLHSGFRRYGLDSSMQVAIKTSDDPSVVGPSSKAGKLLTLARPSLGKAALKLQASSNSGLRSANILSGPMSGAIASCSANVVNLHWVNGETLSIREIGHITKPVVWTLHDMWAFCGTEHYTGDGADARFSNGYRAENRPADSHGLDLDRWAWRRKCKYWRRPQHVICPSNWLASCARKSILMANWPIHTVPNPLDTDLFKPLDKQFCRDALGLPQHLPLIAFGALGGGADQRKGFDLLVGALDRLRNEPALQAVECVVFGQSNSSPKLDMPIPTRFIGHLKDDWSLALLYNSVDAIVVPSRQENLPQTVTEAQACGCPVAAFDVTGMPDALAHGETGYLARPFDVVDLRRGIAWILTDKDRWWQLSTASRQRAVRLWNTQTVVTQYLEVFKAACERSGARGQGQYA